MKRTALFLSVAAMVMLLASAAVPKQEKVDVCHVPPGNPANAHTISVGAPAVPAHLAHGDTLGPCPGDPPPVCEDSVDFPTCGGPCPPGFDCVPTPLGTCECQEPPPLVCEDSLDFPLCGGECPPGLACVPDPSGVPVCVCEPPLVCEDSLDFPLCGGECPPGLACVPIPGAPLCICEPPPPNGSCEGRCEPFDPAAACQCDEECSDPAIDDCCEDSCDFCMIGCF